MNHTQSRRAEQLTPAAIVEELDRHIIGQPAAKRAVAVALRNRWRRQQLDPELRDEVTPRNIIMIGPTGVGKTEIARRLARLAHAPFLKIEASKFTEVGYVGRDVESMIRDLVELAIDMVRAEAFDKLTPRAAEYADEILLTQLEGRALAAERPPLDEREDGRSAFVVGSDGVAQRDAQATDPRDLLRRRLRAGDLDAELVELELPEGHHPAAQLLGAQARTPQQRVELGSVLDGFFPKPRKKKRLPVRDARRLLIDEELGRLIDHDQLIREAIARTERSGIIFLDELDKIAAREPARHGPDVSREGVQRDLLPIVEGTSVSTRHGIVKTDHILFIAAGAFHVARPSDLIPELQGRFPVRVELEALSRDDLRRILIEPHHSLIRQHVALLATERVELSFTPEAIDRLAELAWRTNQRLENIGARRLHTLLERVLEDISFHAPELRHQAVEITAHTINTRLHDVLGDDDMSRYVL